MTTQLIILRPDDLAVLRGSRPRPRPRVTLAPSLGLREARRVFLERRINRSLSACGCNEGSVAGLLYLVAVATLALSESVTLSVASSLTAAGGCIAALTLGKIFGLVRARWRLLRAVRTVERLARRAAQRA